MSAAPSMRAVFLDRDGTINGNKGGYVHVRKDFKFLPGSIPALKRLTDHGYLLIIITNQSGIGRGFFTADTLHALHDAVLEELAKEGVTISGVYYCPHRPEDGCLCRKPGTELIERAARDFHIDLTHSWMVGDADSDVAAGRAAGVRTIKIGSPTDPAADATVTGLAGAADAILRG